MIDRNMLVSLIAQGGCPVDKPCGLDIPCIQCADEVLAGYETEIRADQMRKCKEEFKRALKNHWLNGTVAHRIIDEILDDYEEQKGDAT